MPVGLKLFGVPSLTKDGLTDSTVPLQLSLPTLFLVYLALRSHWVARTELAFLFRPDAPEASAKRYLRQLLHRAKQLGWADSLEVKDELVRFSIPSDIAKFKTEIQQKNWQEAIKLYESDLLASYTHAELATYNAWLELERSNLLEAFKLALQEQAKIFEAQAQFKEAADLLERYLKSDILDEAVLSSYLSLSQQTGLRDKALTLYKRFCETLKTEFAMEPLDETRALAETLMATSVLNRVTPKEQVRHNLPTQANRFIGRQKDLEILQTQLTKADCRVLSLIGLGGSGKTRLSLALGKKMLVEFKEGVYFVALSSASTQEDLLRGIAQALGLVLSTATDPKEELLNHLANKNVLLILDNVEQLKSTAPFIINAVQKTKKLKIMVTSRLSLNLKSEWLFDVQGLTYPLDTDEEPLSFDAVKLFLNGIHKVNPSFLLQTEDIHHITKITQKVEGLPLALELASKWHRLLSFKQIHQELEQNLDLLATEQSDIPKRQQSIAFIFEQTWLGLSSQQQSILARLAIFRGGFSVEAAKSVCKTHLPSLLNLLNQGLIRKQATERFDMHELVRQYAAQKLIEQGALENAQSAHLAYFISVTKDGHIKTREQGGEELMASYAPDLENLFAALEHARVLKKDAAYQRLTADTWYFLYSKGLFLEVLHYLNTVYKRGGTVNKYLAYCTQGLGVMNIILGHYDKGEHYISETLEQAESLDLDHCIQGCANVLGIRHRRVGDYEKAQEYFERAYELGLKTGGNFGPQLSNLGANYILMQRFAEAQPYLFKALEKAREIGIASLLSDCLINLTSCELILGNLDQVERYSLENLALEVSPDRQIQIHSLFAQLYYARLDIPSAKKHADKGLASLGTYLSTGSKELALRVASKVALLMGNLKLAKQYATECLTSCHNNNAQIYLIQTLPLVAEVELALGNQYEALVNLKESLELLKKHELRRTYFEIFSIMATYLSEENPQQAYQLIQTIKMAQHDMGIIPTPLLQQQFDKIETGTKKRTSLLEIQAISEEEAKSLVEGLINQKLELSE